MQAAVTRTSRGARRLHVWTQPGPVPVGGEGLVSEAEQGHANPAMKPPLPGWPLAMSLSVAGAASCPHGSPRVRGDGLGPDSPHGSLA